MDEYEYVETDGVALANIADSHADSAGDPIEVAMSAGGTSAYKALRPELQAQLDIFLSYELTLSRDRAGDVDLVSMDMNVGAARPIAKVPSDVKQLWSAIAAAARTAMIRGLACDLVFESKGDTTPSHVDRLIREYQRVAQEKHIDDLHRGHALLRADSLIRRRRLPGESDHRVVMEDFVDSLPSPHLLLGVIGPLMRGLSREPATYDRPEAERERVLALLRKVAESGPLLPVADFVAECVRIASRNPQDREAGARQHVQAYLNVARADQSGFARMHTAQEAARLAKSYELNDLHSEAVQLMQTIPPGSLEWQVVEHSSTLPGRVIRHHLSRYKHADNWQQAMQIFLSGTAPAGSYANNWAIAGKNSEGSIRSLVKRIRFGSHGLPERSGNNFREEELCRLEEVAVGFYGRVLNWELVEVWERFGPVDEHELANFMSRFFQCPDDLGRYFAQALHHHWAQRPSDAARLSIPLIEAGARRLLLALDEALFRIEQGSSPGRFPAMDFYVDKLEEVEMDIDWTRSLRAVLLSTGLNLRNRAAHGFVFDVDEANSAVLIRLAGLFCAMPLGSTRESALRAVNDPLGAPHSGLRRRLRLRWEWH